MSRGNSVRMKLKLSTINRDFDEISIGNLILKGWGITFYFLVLVKCRRWVNNFVYKCFFYIKRS